MFSIVSHLNKHALPNELNQSFELRHKVLVEELEWDGVTGQDGKELDQFDGDGVIYLLVRDDVSGRVVGTARLVHSMLPNLSSVIFRSIFKDEKVPHGLDIYDGSRFVMDASTDEPNRYMNQLFLGIAEIGLHLNLSVVTGISYYKLFQKLVVGGLPLKPLGLPESDGAEDIIALYYDLKNDALSKMKKAFDYDPGPLLSDADVEVLRATHRWNLSRIESLPSAA